MLEALGGLLGSVLSGGATGIIGVAIQRFADYKNAQLQMQLEKQRGDQELAKRNLDIQLAREEYAGKLRIAETEGETAKDVAASQAFGLSVWKEPERYSDSTRLTVKQQWFMVILDTIRGIVRPGLTIYLCALTTYVWIQVRRLISVEDLDQAAALEVWKMVVGTILYLTTTVVLWWFGTRNKQKQPGFS